MEYSVKAPLRNFSDPKWASIGGVVNSKMDFNSVSFQLGRINKMMDESVGKFLKRYLIISAELEEMKREFVGQAANVNDYIKLTRREMRLDKYDHSLAGASSVSLPYCFNYETRSLRSADSKQSKTLRKEEEKRSPIISNQDNVNSYSGSGSLSKKDERHFEAEQAKPILKGKKNRLAQEANSLSTPTPREYPAVNSNNSTDRLKKKAMRHFIINSNQAANFNSNKAKPKRDENDEEDIEALNPHSKRHYNREADNALNSVNHQLKKQNDEYSSSLSQINNSKDTISLRALQKGQKEVHFNQRPLNYFYDKDKKQKGYERSTEEETTQLTKALLILSKSPLLSLDDKLKLCNLNREIRSSLNPIELIKEAMHSIEKRINLLEIQKEAEIKEDMSFSEKSFPSKTAQTSLNLLTKEKEFNLINNDTPINREVFMIFSKCLLVDSPCSSIREGYSHLFRTFEVNSISKQMNHLIINIESLFFDVIYPSIFNENEEGFDDRHSGLIDIIHSNRELIAQSIAMKSNQTPFACIAFSLDEIYKHLTYKRNKQKREGKDNELCYLKRGYNDLRRKMDRLID